MIELTHEVPDWNKKKFRIMDIQEGEDDEFQLEVLEYNESIYGDVGAETAGADRGIPFDTFAVPYHAGRFTAHQRPIDNNFELALTRVATNDLLSTHQFFVKRGSAEFDAIGQGLPAAPTAFIDSEPTTISLIQSGSPLADPDPTSGFSDTFNRSDATSPGAPWEARGQIQELWRISTDTLQRGDTASIEGSVRSHSVLVTSDKTLGADHVVVAQMFDSSGTNAEPFVSIFARWQEAGSTGQYYGMEYASRTASMEIDRISLIRVESGQVTTTLSFVSVLGSEHFTTPESATEFRLRVQGLELTSWLDSVEIVRASDSVITGAGESGFGFRHPFPDEDAYLTMIQNDSAYAFWQFDETDITSVAFDAIGGHHGSFQSDVAGQGHTVQQTGTFIDSSGVRGVGIHFGSGTATVDEGWAQLHFPDHVGSFRSNDFSVEAWYASSLHFFHDGQVTLVAFGTNDEWGVAVDANRQLSFRTEFPITTITGATSLEQDFRFYHIVALRSVESRHMAIFVDGTLDASATMASEGGISSKANAVSIAAGLLANFFTNHSELFGVVDQVAYYPYALSSAQIFQHFKCGVGSGCQEFNPTQGERWDAFSSGPLLVNTSEILVQHVPDGWSGRIFRPNSEVVVSALASDTNIIFDWALEDSPTSGFLLLFSDGSSFLTGVKGGRFPNSGDSDFVQGDVYDYILETDFITDIQTFIPIFSPKGGFANVGSARIRAEEIGYDTFTDSRLEGVTRGAGGTTALSHTNIVSLEATVMESGGALVDLSAAFTDVDSNVEFFAENSTYLYLGASSKFSLISAFLARNAGGGLNPQYEYSIGDGLWASALTSGFVPPFDETSGFQRSGNIFLEPWGDWSPTNATLPGSADLSDATSRYYLRILRAASVGTIPAELQFSVQGDLVTTVRKANAFIYPTVAVDSGQSLTFKAIATGPKGQQADGTKAPVFTIVES